MRDPGVEKLIPVPRHWIVCDLAQIKLGDVSGDIHEQIDAPFPFEKADFGTRADPRTRQEGGVENRAVEAMYEKEIEFDSFRRVLGCRSKVRCKKAM
jgi:hypothetical protein